MQAKINLITNMTKNWHSLFIKGNFSILTNAMYYFKPSNTINLLIPKVNYHNFSYTNKGLQGFYIYL